MANFKPRRGDYAADMSLYTVEADSYEPNDYGLYNMSGNVSEWTTSTYTKDAYEYTASMNPNYSNFKDKQKVIRGGSWKDVAYYLRVATRDYEYADTAKSYIGFRLVRDELGSNEVEN
jgi:gliding motility-associated lipoprotein GldK